MRDTFIRKLTELAEQQPEIMFITGDLGYCSFDDFQDRFPDQYLNAGVAEQNMAGIATGMALEGRIVFIYSIGNFPTLRCLEQIRNGACYHNANVKIITVGGGFSYGALGFSHHATEDIGIMRSLPGMKVIVPADLWEVEYATQSIVNQPGPFYLRLDKSSAGKLKPPEDSFEIGKARLIQEGKDITIIGSGGILGEAIAAADELEKKGVKCRIISMHTVKPIDVQAIKDAVANTRGIITLEENVAEAGLGSAIAEVCLDNNLSPEVFSRIALRNITNSVVGDQQYLREFYKIDKKNIIITVEDCLAKIN